VRGAIGVVARIGKNGELKLARTAEKPTSIAVPKHVENRSGRIASVHVAGLVFQSAAIWWQTIGKR